MANQGGSTLAGFSRPDLQLHVRSSTQNYDPRREKSTSVNIGTVTHQFSLRVLNRLLHHNRKIKYMIMCQFKKKEKCSTLMNLQYIFNASHPFFGLCMLFYHWHHTQWPKDLERFFYHSVFQLRTLTSPVSVCHSRNFPSESADTPKPPPVTSRLTT